MAPYRIKILIKSDSYEYWPSIHVLKKFDLFAKNWAHKGIDLAPNPYYWALTQEEPIAPSRHDAVQNLDADNMKDPFKAARWIARMSFQHKVLQDRPHPLQDSYSSSGRGRGRGTSRGTGAKRNRKALKSSPGFETESQEELNPQTILECGSGLESRSRDPTFRRGRSRGPGVYTSPSTQKTALQAKQADQSSDKPYALALLVAMKFRK